MRQVADAERIWNFMRALGHEADEDSRLYFTGGATAVLQGRRSATIDVDILLVPERDRLFRTIPGLKERFQLNVELASPADFIPELPGWQDRSLFITREGKVSFYHYDLYAQALAKTERGHSQDVGDVQQMIRLGLTYRLEKKTGKPFRVRARSLGVTAGLDYDNVGELLEQLEGPRQR